VFIEAMDVYGDYFPGFAAVVSAAGVTPFKPIPALTAADYTASYTSKALGQIDLVGHGKRHERAAIRQDALNLMRRERSRLVGARAAALRRAPAMALGFSLKATATPVL
jgi:hypothetical protein